MKVCVVKKYSNVPGENSDLPVLRVFYDIRQAVKTVQEEEKQNKLIDTYYDEVTDKKDNIKRMFIHFQDDHDKPKIEKSYYFDVIDIEE